MIEICNLRKDSLLNAYDIRVDRASALGNPFRMSCEIEREEVCKKYEQWFYEQIASNNVAFMNELRMLYIIHKQYGKLRLFCWCYPKRCHAETIKRFLEKYIEKGGEISENS